MLTRRTITRGGLALAAGAASRFPRANAADIVVPWEDQGDVPVASGKIHWATIGRGEPLVLMPKLGGWIADWRHVAKILSARYRVILIDHPGHGDSTLTGPVPYMLTVPESAGMIMAALDELGLDRCMLCGNSLGGCIAAVCAALWPEKFSKLVLLSCALGDARTMEDVRGWHDNRARHLYDAEGRPVIRGFEEMMKGGGVLDRTMYEESNASRAKAGAWVRAAERGVVRAGIAGYLSRIQASTLLIYGERGGYKQFEANALATIPKVKSVHIPNASSFTHQDQPEATAKVMMDFLA